MASWLDDYAPHELGLPEKFTSWVPGQLKALDDILRDDNRIIPVCAPTGTGKSLIGVAAILVNGGRGGYVTSTNALMDQAEADFTSCGMKLVRGRRNYECEWGGGGYNCDECHKKCLSTVCPAHGKYKCNAADCEAWAGECPYKLAFQGALNSSLTLTNYAYWCRMGRTNGIGKYDFIVLDEAHDAPDELARAMSVNLRSQEIKLCLSSPRKARTIADWAKWAADEASRLSEHGTQAALANAVVELKITKSPMAAARMVDKMVEKLNAIKAIDGDWVSSGSADLGVQFEPVWPYQHAERFLFQGVKKILLMSATLTRKTLSLLGVSRGAFQWHNYPYTFPRRNSPTVHIKTTRVSHKLFMTAAGHRNKLKWLDRIVEIIEARDDRKGIIHTVSFERQREIMEHVRRMKPHLEPYCLIHKRGEAAQAIETLKRSKVPRVLLSPSASTGYDFPGEECEYVVIPKMPFPPLQSKVMQERSRLDKQYPSHLMIQTLVQSAGRGMRSKNDFCEIFILDDSWVWIKATCSALIPTWFQVRSISAIPRRPPSLRDRRASQEARASEGA